MFISIFFNASFRAAASAFCLGKEIIKKTVKRRKTKSDYGLFKWNVAIFGGAVVTLEKIKSWSQNPYHKSRTSNLIIFPNLSTNGQTCHNIKSPRLAQKIKPNRYI